MCMLPWQFVNLAALCGAAMNKKEDIREQNRRRAKKYRLYKKKLKVLSNKASASSESESEQMDAEVQDIGKFF